MINTYPFGNVKTSKRRKISARQGDPRAQFELARAYRYGHGGEPDERKFRKWCKKAAKRGYPRAVKELGLDYALRSDIGSVAKRAKLEEKALKWLELASSHACPEAFLELGHLYVRRNEPERAVHAWKGGAQIGDDRCAHELGKFFSDRKEQTKAVKWWRVAAERGYKRAAYRLGLVYAADPGFVQQRSEAEHCFEFSNATVELGLLYAGGIGVAQDCELAAESFRIACRNADASDPKSRAHLAMVGLGILRATGMGVPENHRKARDYFERAALFGNIPASQILEIAYPECEKDVYSAERKLNWYRKQAQRNESPLLMEMLACILAIDPRHRNLAVRWAEEATYRGSLIGSALFGLLPSMPEDQ